MLELWGMWCTPSWSLLSGPFWPEVVGPDKGPIYGLNRTKPWLNCFLHLSFVLILNWIAWNKTVLTSKLCTYAGAVEYTDCTSAEGKDTPPPMSVLDMTLNNLMVRFQWCWGFGECRASLYRHCSEVHSGLEAPNRALSMS